MANPQPDIHTRISNEIMDVLAMCRFSGAETSVLFAVIRQTWGFQIGSRTRRTRYMTLAFLASLTGLHRSHCCRAVKSLTQKGLLLVQMRGQNMYIGVQKDYDKWVCRRLTPPVAETSNGVTKTSNEPLPKPAINKRKNKRVVEEGLPTPLNDPSTMTEAERQFEEHWPYQGKSDEIRRYIGEHGEENVLKAIHEATLRETQLEKLRFPILKIRDLLETQKAQNYSWKRPDSRDGPRKPPIATKLAEVDAFFEMQPLYRALRDDLSFAPFHALNRMRELAPTYGIDPLEFSPLSNNAIPKDEQVALIRRFVSLTLRAPTVPTDA